MDPIDNVKRFHHGCDFSVNIGTPVYAPVDGSVKELITWADLGTTLSLTMVQDTQQFLLIYQK